MFRFFVGDHSKNRLADLARSGSDAQIEHNPLWPETGEYSLPKLGLSGYKDNRFRFVMSAHLNSMALYSKSVLPSSRSKILEKIIYGIK